MGWGGYRPSSTRRETIKALWANPEWRARTMELRRKALKQAWTPERRKEQSERAKHLNRTMPKSMRKANGKKIQDKAKERFNDPAFRERWRNRGSNATAGAQRVNDLRAQARELLAPIGLYVEDNASEKQLKEIIKIFGK